MFACSLQHDRCTRTWLCKRNCQEDPKAAIQPRFAFFISCFFDVNDRSITAGSVKMPPVNSYRKMIHRGSTRPDRFSFLRLLAVLYFVETIFPPTHRPTNLRQEGTIIIISMLSEIYLYTVNNCKRIIFVMMGCSFSFTSTYQCCVSTI